MSRSSEGFESDHNVTQGVVPDFENPELVGYHSISIACGICMAMILLVSGLRLYTKIRLIKKTMLDDCKCTLQSKICARH